VELGKRHFLAFSDRHLGVEQAGLDAALDRGAAVRSRTYRRAALHQVRRRPHRRLRDEQS
jgi:hypothetical protein